MITGTKAGLHVEAAASRSGTHFGVGNVAQLHTHHPEPKGGILVGHQLQRSNAVQLMQLLRHIKGKGVPARMTPCCEYRHYLLTFAPECIRAT